MLLSQLLRAPIGSRLVRTDFDDDTLTLGIATTNPNASCSVCGHETWRVHSRYTRCLAEEPVFGRRVRLQMTVRRFLCNDLRCPRRIFVEPLNGFAARQRGRPRDSPSLTSPSAQPWVVKPGQGWR